MLVYRRSSMTPIFGSCIVYMASLTYKYAHHEYHDARFCQRIGKCGADDPNNRTLDPGVNLHELWEERVVGQRPTLSHNICARGGRT